MATRLFPRNTGLPAYLTFNCYGLETRWRWLIPKKHRKMIVEITKTKYYDGKVSIPIEVSEFPKILLRGRKLKRALTLFSPQEWEVIYSYISRNRQAIERHWMGETSSGELFDELNGMIRSD
jgi:hypothetical protein